MSLEKIADKVVETDVLVIGGGIAGCPAAAKAAEHGLRVTLADKSKPERSGSASQGIDHYGAFPRGITSLEMVKRDQESGMLRGLNGPGRWVNPNISYKIYDKAFWALEELEKLGIPMKWDDGDYYWMPHRFRGIFNGLRVHWQDVKPLMAAAVRKRGVNVLERTMVVDLLTNNGRVAGATAVNTRNGEFIVIKAKAVVIATGAFARCYNPETPLIWKYKLRYHWCPATVSGDGWALAYRAGAELASMDITGWTFRIRDDPTISFGNFTINDGIPSKTLTWDGEELGMRPTASKYAELEQAAKTPLYLTLENLNDDFHKRIEVSYVDERLISFKIAEDRGFNPRSHWYDVMPNKPHNFFGPASGIHTDEDFQTTLKGLFAVGDCTNGNGNGCGGADTSGLIVGDNLPAFVNEAGETPVDETQVESQRQKALAPFIVKEGTEPMELECAIRYICERYVGQFKSEGKLREGKRRLGSLRRVFLPKLMAKNPHYLMRCLEVRNIMDLTELHIDACFKRKETRGNFIRLDFPEEDASRENMITYQRLDNREKLLEIREVPDLN